MNEDDVKGLQKDIGTMSDDDVAALLGFTTTLTQHAHFGMSDSQPQGQPQAPQEQSPQQPQAPQPQEQAPQSSPAGRDDEQDMEIEQIRAELQKLQDELAGNQNTAAIG